MGDGYGLASPMLQPVHGRYWRSWHNGRCVMQEIGESAADGLRCLRPVWVVAPSPGYALLPKGCRARRGAAGWCALRSRRRTNLRPQPEGAVPRPGGVMLLIAPAFFVFPVNFLYFRLIGIQRLLLYLANVGH
ncbi:MAG: hypothetical protein EAY75_09265 [Bacteroidetes bacterium]|nr:MAG: hypothetical protein EAY75_09265 [Bacteroidota bacterium]